MAVVMPSLSEDGWVVYPGSIVDYAFAHFFLSDYSQSYIYNGAVSSFAWVIEESQGDYMKLQNLMTVTLQNYLGRYFSKVTVDCDVRESTTNPNLREMYLYVSVTDNEGKEHVVGKMLNYENNKVLSVVNVNNYGNEIPSDVGS